MHFPKKKHLSSVIFLIISLIIAVQSASLATDQQKIGKSGKKVLDLPPSKKPLNKKATEDHSRNVEEYGRINLAQSSVYETQAQLGVQYEEKGWQSGRNKKSEEKQHQSGVNRFKRDVSSLNVESTEPSYLSSAGNKQISKNYKKLKLTQSEAASDADRRDGYTSGQKMKKYVEVGKNISKKKTVHHHVSHYATEVEQSDINRDNPERSSRLRRDAILASKTALRANTSDYYALRRAVMERFYARQREIAERVAKQSTSTPRNIFRYDLKPDIDREDLSTTKKTVENNQEDIISNNFLSGGGQNVPADNSRLDSTTQEASTTQRIILEDNYGPDIRNELSPLNSENLDCDNIPRSGNFLPKRQSGSKNRNCRENRRDEADDSEENEPITRSSETSSQQWGTCTGKVVYQHNLLLGVKGPSNLDTMFEVAIQGPICVTCVESIRYNETRAMVTLESGGRGYQFIKLRLKGFENEGFSYIVKVWGIRKTGHYCEK